MVYCNRQPIVIGVLFGSKKTAYYKDEMMYGETETAYTISELSESEINILYGKDNKNKANNINKQLDSSGNNK